MSDSSMTEEDVRSANAGESAPAGAAPATEDGTAPAAGETAPQPDPAAADAVEAASGGDVPVKGEAARSDAPVMDEAPPEPAGPSAELKAIVEALIFASPEPITPRTLYKLLSDEPKEDVAAAIAALKADYENRLGLQLVEVAGGYQIVTRPQLHEWVRRLFHERSTQKLSVQALETLAVIAYKQPITALEIAEIRGVNTSGVLSTLLERHLIKIVGRKNVVGRPFLYATTKEFLIRFGLKDLNDLPKIEDMAEALGFDPPAGLVEQTPREEILPLDEPEPGEEAAPDQERREDRREGLVEAAPPAEERAEVRPDDVEGRAEERADSRPDEAPADRSDEP